MFTQLVYTSSSTKVMLDSELDHLLAEARANNKKHGVTGFLLYDRGRFVQMLEGEDETVRDLFYTISNDDRNSGCIMLNKSTVNERSFPEWSMAYHKITDADRSSITGYDDFFKQLDSEKPGVDDTFNLKRILHDYVRLFSS